MPRGSNGAPVESAVRADAHRDQSRTNAGSTGRKFILFADGTGSAFTTQESNVWRLYEALDRTKPDQVAYYIKGVGTAGWRPFAALDGATGIGVPSNVRRLYRFLCWNWQPGDEIYMFGFSRGSFTARTLTALIASEGLVPAVIDQAPVTHAEMRRNAMAAWRSYRRRSVRSSLTKSLLTIWIARWVRDAVLWAYHRILRHRSYADVRTYMDRTHGPFRGDPFARRMSKHSGEAKKPGIFVDCGSLDCRDLIPAKALADDVETARQRGVAEGPVFLTGERGSDGRNKRLLGIGQFRLRLGQRCRNGADTFTGAVHGCPPCSRHQSSPHRIWIVWLGCHGQSLPWRPRA